MMATFILWNSYILMNVLFYNWIYFFSLTGVQNDGDLLACIIQLGIFQAAQIWIIENYSLAKGFTQLA